MKTKIILFSYLFLVGISLSSCGNGTNEHMEPEDSFLDSLADANSDLLYDWDEVSINDNKGVSSKHLIFKTERRVNFSYEGAEYQMIPFFKTQSNGTTVASVHFFIEKRHTHERLEDLSFTDLRPVDKNNVYFLRID